MAKKKITITVDQKILDWIESKTKSSVYRNRSHAFEFAINQLMDEN